MNQKGFASIVAVVVILAASAGTVSAATLAELQEQLRTLAMQLSALQAQQGAAAAPPASISSGQASGAASCPNLTRNLSRGLRGADVTALQTFLISQNLLASDSATGFFGALTESAVKQWQSNNNIASNGTPATTGWGAIGPRTRAAIAHACNALTKLSENPQPTPPCCKPTPTTSIPPPTNLNPVTVPNPICEHAAPPNGCSWQSGATCVDDRLVCTTVSCTPLPSQTQTLSCPTGQTGSITQTRTSSCPGPTWTVWSITSNTCAVPLVDRGWDSGLLHRRAAFYKTDPSIYFESCPDDVGGCYNNGNGISIGGGFYTLSPGLGTSTCKVNSGTLAPVTNADGSIRQESCPFYFAWTTNAAGHTAAKITLDTSSWTNAFTSNNYFGFHENPPQGLVPNGMNYFGGQNLPTIDTARMQVTLAGSILLPNNDSSRGRFLAGISWYVPSMQKSITLEMNLNNVSNQYTEQAWSTTALVTPNPNCSAAETCLYLGSQYWSISPVSQGDTSIVVEWSKIAQRLVNLGYLPAAAYGSYQTSVFYVGPETLGKAKVQLTVSDFRIQSVQ